MLRYISRVWGRVGDEGKLTGHEELGVGVDVDVELDALSSC
jgi:hypothetical protein